MGIRGFDASSRADIDGWIEVDRAARSVDAPDLPPPCRQDLLGGIAVPWPGQRSRRWVAEVDGRVVGILSLGFGEIDNLDNVETELIVDPAFRRRGIGTALCQLAVAEVRREGRKRLIAESSVRSLPDGAARPGAGSLFAPTTGAKLGQTEVRRRLDVPTVDRPALVGRIAELADRATGYSLTSWTGMAPDDIVAGIAELDSRFLSEAPLGDLAWEPERVDVARMHEAQRSKAARGRRSYDTIARHDATGEVVAWSGLDMPHCPDGCAEQNITLVLPEHRGHRLGLLVKLANLVQALDAEPALSVIDTWNAEENSHMIAVNEALGFRPVDVWDAWQLDL